mgnify:CR=1 FL=1
MLEHALLNNTRWLETKGNTNVTDVEPSGEREDTSHRIIASSEETIWRVYPYYVAASLTELKVRFQGLRSTGTWLYPQVWRKRVRR